MFVLLQDFKIKSVLRLHTVTTVCDVQLSEGFEGDKNKTKYILNLFSIMCSVLSWLKEILLIKGKMGFFFLVSKPLFRLKNDFQ